MIIHEQVEFHLSLLLLPNTGLDSRDRVSKVPELCVLRTGLDSRDRVSKVPELCVLRTGLDSRDRVSKVDPLCLYKHFIEIQVQNFK
jgi:hypothetical protein